MSVQEFLVSILVLLSRCVYPTLAIGNRPGPTWILSYDGIVSPKLMKLYRRDEDPDSNKHGPVPYNMVIDLSTRIGTDIIKLIALGKFGGQEGMSEDDRTLDLDRRCYKPLMGGGKCDIDHYRKGEDVLQVSVQYEQSDDESIAFRLDASLSTTNSFLTRDVLVRSIPKINDHIMYHQNVVWSIRDRPSVPEMIHEWDTVSSIASSQMNKDKLESSIQKLILQRADIQKRMRIDSANMVYTEEQKPPLEVWHYELPEHKYAIRSLFVNGHLQSTTLPAGNAHAEALVHPAMISVLSPKKIMILSLEPTSILREVLKHKAVESVTVLGHNRGAVEMVQKHMSTLDDCKFLQSDEISCFRQDIVEMIEMDVEDWLRVEFQVAFESNWQYPYFDAIFVDVPGSNSRWLAKDFQRMIDELVDDESAVVLAAGSMPSMFDQNDDNFDFSPRDLLLKESHRSRNNGGLGYNQLYPYDEPLARPLASSFFVLFPDSSEASGNFVRTNGPAIEIDIIQQLHGGIGETPTLVYDGQTHTAYQNPSRSWQHWYCNTFPGRELPICSQFLRNWYDASRHHYDDGFHVRHDPTKGRSLSAKVDIPEGHFILPDDAALSIKLDVQRWRALEKFVETHPTSQHYMNVHDFFVAYGFETENLGQTGWSSSIASNNTFTNHGCTDWEKNAAYVSDILTNEDGDFVGFSPVLQRYAQLSNHLVVAGRDITVGEDIMMDYSTFRSSQAEKDKHAELLASICGNGVGHVPVAKEPESTLSCEKDEL